MKNLLEETCEALAENGKTRHDVSWVGWSKGNCDWETFSKYADQEYDNGFGIAEVNEDLVVVGDDWWLERWEYDGSEGWSFKTRPTIHPAEADPRLLIGYEARWGLQDD